MVLLSILIYTYKRKEYLLKAVDSVLSNEFDPSKFEILVVKGFKDNDIDNYLFKNGIRTLFVDDKSLGVKLARGIRECKGVFVCFLDDDDEFESDKLEIISNLLEKDDRLDFIHNSISVINEGGNTINTSPKENVSGSISFNPGTHQNSTLSRLIRHRGDWYLSAMCIRKSVILKVIDELDFIDQSVDKFIFYAALNFGKEMMMVDNRVTRYRLHQSTTTYAGTMNEFMEKRQVFFENSVRVFNKIVEISRDRSGSNLANCQLIQHRINLYFISGNKNHKVTMTELLKFVSCLKYSKTRFQFIWIVAYFVRKISLEISRLLYFKFFEVSFRKVLDD